MKISTGQASAISQAMDRIKAKIDTTQCIGREEFLSLYWTPEEQQDVKKVEHLIGITGENSLNEDMASVYATLPDTIPYHGGTQITVQLKAQTSYCALWPRVANGFTSNPPKEAWGQLEQIAAHVMAQALIKGMWKYIKEFYTERCPSHEAMRYLFPGTVYILRQAGLGHIASKVEAVKKPPSLPNLLPAERKIFRFMNEWFAMQMLLGTFESSLAVQPIRMVSDVYLRIARDVTFMFGADDEIQVGIKTDF